MTVYEALFENVSDTEDFTDPADNPTLTLDCGGRSTVGFWVVEPTGDVTVQIYSSIDNSTWRAVDSYSTDADGNAYDTLSIGCQYIKVEIQNTADGDYTIEISASR